MPLGDPAASRVDPKLAGVWNKEADGKGWLVFVAAADQHAYIVDAVQYTKEGDSSRYRDHFVFQGWLTELKGPRFMTLNFLRLMVEPAGSSEKKFYPTLRIALADDVLTTRALDEKFPPIAAAKDAAELARVIEENLETPQMYGESSSFHRLDSQKDKDFIDKVMAAQ